MSSEKRPIAVRNPAARRKGNRAMVVSLSSCSVMYTSVMMIRRTPVEIRPRLKINARTKGLGPISVRVQCPRSLKAFSTQLKFGDNKIERAIHAKAISGAIDPLNSSQCLPFPRSIKQLPS